MSLCPGTEYGTLYVARVASGTARTQSRKNRLPIREWQGILARRFGCGTILLHGRDGWHGIAPPVSRGGDRFDLDQCSWSKVGGSNLGRFDDDRAPIQGRRVKCASPTQKTVTEHFHSFCIGR